MKVQVEKNTIVEEPVVVDPVVCLLLDMVVVRMEGENTEDQDLLKDIEMTTEMIGTEEDLHREEVEMMGLGVLHIEVL